MVIFLATHGNLPAGRPRPEVNYIVTSDTELTPQDSLFATSLAMVELSDVGARADQSAPDLYAFSRYLPQRCGHDPGEASVPRALPTPPRPTRHSTGFARALGVRSLPPAGRRTFWTRGRHFRTATSTHFLLEALRQNNGMDTIEQVYCHAEDNLPKAVAARTQRRRGVQVEDAAPISQQATQTPVLRSSVLGGEIVLGIPAAVVDNSAGIPQPPPLIRYSLPPNASEVGLFCAIRSTASPSRDGPRN